MKTAKILLADDQQLIRESLQIILHQEKDIEIVGLAENGRVAVDMCDRFQPDIVLMDIHMPEMDGIEATRKIKQQWPDIKVIILTTFQDSEYTQEAVLMGAEGYLLKAIHPKDLINGIRSVINGSTVIPG